MAAMDLQISLRSLPSSATSSEFGSDETDKTQLQRTPSTHLLDSARSVYDQSCEGVKGFKNSIQTHGGNFSVVQGFKGSTVLITGATGYVGKLILEQLFRTCPEVKKVFLIIRGSKTRDGRELSPEQRFRQMLKSPEMLYLANQPETVLSRIRIVPGDLSGTSLGLEESDTLEMIREVDFIIHCAASIRFDQPISEIMMTNYASTALLLDLAAQMPKLKCFTYMSTAYVNSNQPRHSVIEEKIYPLPGTLDPLEVADTLMSLPPRKADRLAQRLMRQWGLQNTYFMAKTLSERLVMSFDQQPFPVCIVRPSLIGCVAGDPFPGYIGNSSGFTSLILGSLAGIIKFIQHNPTHNIAVVPGDTVSSATLVATIAVATIPEKVSNIVHICSSDTYPLMNKAVHSHIGAYLSIDPVENPGQTLVKDGNYSVDWIRHRSSFNLRCASRRIKLEAIKGVLQLQGKSRQGKKVVMAHKFWTSLGSSKHDYNFTFQTPTTSALYDMMPTIETNFLKPVWREDLGDSWVRYLRTYTAGVKHIYLKEEPRITDQQCYTPRG